MLEIIRTPSEHFEGIRDFPFEEHYCNIGGMEMHYVDEGPRDGEVVLLLHGEPSWSYLYRKMIPIIAEGGYRVIAPDLIGFGKSDKIVDKEHYTYERHVSWMLTFLEELKLTGITLFCQDWGGLIGLRLVAEHEHLFARIMASNTILATGEVPPNKAFMAWREFSRTSPEFDIGRVIQGGTVSSLSDEVIAAYNAPFPEERYKSGARIFPSLVPISPDDPSSPRCKSAWARLMELKLPFLTAFSDSDPIMSGLDKVLQSAIPGAKGQNHTVIQGAGHFVQEEKGVELAHILVRFIQDNPGDRSSSE